MRKLSSRNDHFDCGCSDNQLTTLLLQVTETLKPHGAYSFSVSIFFFFRFLMDVSSRNQKSSYLSIFIKSPKDQHWQTKCLFKQKMHCCKFASHIGFLKCRQSKFSNVALGLNKPLTFRNYNAYFDYKPAPIMSLLKAELRMLFLQQLDTNLWLLGC